MLSIITFLFSHTHKSGYNRQHNDSRHKKLKLRHWVSFPPDQIPLWGKLISKHWQMAQISFRCFYFGVCVCVLPAIECQCQFVCLLVDSWWLLCWLFERMEQQQTLNTYCHFTFAFFLPWHNVAFEST